MASIRFTLKEIISDLLNTKESLYSPLFKLQYFANLIQNKELLDYTTREIEGYSLATEVPEYRKARTTLLVEIERGGKIQTKEWPMVSLESTVRYVLGFVGFTEGIQVVESYINKLDPNNDRFVTEVPESYFSYIKSVVERSDRWSRYETKLTAARTTIDPNIIITIISSVRKKLLNFAIGLQDFFGEEIEISNFKENQIKNNQTIINIMNTTINNHGDGNVVNTGDHSNVNPVITINKGDIAKFTEELEKQGIEKEDVKELIEIVTTDKHDFENKKLGKKTDGWLKKIGEKAWNGVGKIASSASGNLLATLIKGYIGMDS